MKYMYSGVLTLLFVGVLAVAPSAHAETTTSVTSMLEQIKALMAKVEELQKQLGTVRGEVKSVLKAGLEEGATDEDIKKIQEILATDSSIYPEGKVTGYFGPLTKEAIKRFQTRHELEVTGVLDEDTHDLLEEYLHESFGDKIPPGLLKAPGIAKKIEMRYELKCKNEDEQRGMGHLCKRLKMKHHENGTKDDLQNKFNVEIEVEDDETSLSFTLDGADYDVTIDSTEINDVLDAAANAITNGDTAEDLTKELKYAIAKAFDHENHDEDDEND